MKCTLVGVQDVDFDGKNGKVDGVKLHYVHIDGNVIGNVATNSWVERHVFNSFGVAVKDLLEFIDTAIDLEFNPKGKLVGLRV